ncbi:MAG TPA: transcription antitermination factor NusB [Stellaceae bacterium]|jgi:N utilization substance protein B|nr:transcription antitermination factor NusB [Stellaceae bacterium]
MGEDAKPESKPARAVKAGGARSAARLAAVQAIYQIEMTDGNPRNVVAEFGKYRLNPFDADGDELVSADETLFAELVSGTYAQLPELDAQIAKVLAADWPIERLEMVLRAILRLGAYELASRIDVPARVVITEYLDIAHAFFAGKEPGMVNGVLDRLAHLARGGEMSRDR